MAAPKERWIEGFASLLGKISARKDAEFFHDPVPWEELGLFDYLQVIQQPMDLSTVRTKLFSGEYKSVIEAADDMRLIFSNAMTYNLPGSKVYNCAKSLGNVFENNFNQLQRKVAENKKKPANIEDMSVWIEKCHRYDRLHTTYYILHTACCKLHTLLVL